MVQHGGLSGLPDTKDNLSTAVDLIVIQPDWCIPVWGLKEAAPTTQQK